MYVREEIINLYFDSQILFTTHPVGFTAQRPEKLGRAGILSKFPLVSLGPKKYSGLKLHPIWIQTISGGK